MGRDYYIILFYMIYYLSSGTVNSCDISKINKCVELYRICQQYMTNEICICYRTYYKCIEKYDQSCFNNEIQYIGIKNGLGKIMSENKCWGDDKVFVESDRQTTKAPPIHCSPNLRPAHICQVLANHDSVFLTPYQQTPRKLQRSGAWPMISNNFFTLQITVQKKPISSITRVTAIINKYKNCAGSEFLTYSAYNHEIPNKFKQGTSEEGYGTSISIVDASAVSITMTHINTTIVIRRSSNIGYIVTVLSPTSASDCDSLCLRGCDRSPFTKDITSSQYNTDIKRLMPRYSLEYNKRCSSSANSGRHYLVVIIMLLITISII